MPRPLHPDADAILARLRQEGIAALYHFTNVENLPAICQMQALCSKDILEVKGLTSSSIPGGNLLSHSLDRRNDNWNKVSLSLTPYTPMAYHRKREQHLCFFVIDPEVAGLSGVVFTDTNAARNDHLRGEGLAGLNTINFGAIRSTPRPWDLTGWHRPVQAEVLVPERIPFEYMPGVVFVSPASMMHAERLCGTLLHPSFSIERRLFTDSWQAPEEAVDFSHIVEFILTDVQVDKNMLSFSHLHKNKFSKKEHEYIRLVVRVNVLPGTQAKIFLYSVNIQKTLEHLIKSREFEVSGERVAQYLIKLDTLSKGLYSLKCYLGAKGKDLCWASTNFEVSQ